MAEDAMTQGGSSTRKNIQEAGFSEELKQRLQDRIAESSFKNENAAAISFANLPRSAGKGTRDIAAAAPWTGDESIHDAALRMLDDASKPMRVPFRPPHPGGPIPAVHRKPKRNVSSGGRLAAARERTAEYTLNQDTNTSKEERDSFRKELQERFGPGVYSFPVSIQGLSSLANERIEDAMAKGQFKNIPRGKGENVKRDPTADSPYIDTTEYVMNRILQKQEATPEWIQKQHSMQSEINQFRSRLREDWRNHAILMIRSQGETMETQVRRARAYVAAESRHNKILQARAQNQLNGSADSQGQPSTAGGEEISSTPNTEPLEDLPCLRDPQYLATEREYHELKIKRLNESIRSYNLQAPQVSQRAYLNLQRELDSCYADTALGLPEEIKRRATGRSHNSGLTNGRQEGLGGYQLSPGLGHKARIYDEDSSKGYGFKQMWRDLWG
ncbi:uncharacterized protein GIQ15_02213 [Arthroderma uncinatum]|uniref:uncharacterized protein n=1 Tax=Arthroderma uncinatum TaxID=74035 RepID=UPI00144A7D7C|nr:uncharacterized protein GIQ15_02213 [Arthroderma uncinatum]KAF3482889.1 hypothetical protein GIQ15_02213 [Arthroderma uncinatum]